MSGGAPWRWTSRRDRMLEQLRADGFSFAECAAILTGGSTGAARCAEADARARMKEISSQGAAEAEKRAKPVPEEISPKGAQPSAALERYEGAPEGALGPVRVAAPGPAAEVHRKEASPPVNA